MHKIEKIDITLHVTSLEDTFAWYKRVLNWDSGCDLTNAYFYNTNLTGATLKDCITDGVNLSNNPAVIYGNTICPNGNNSDDFGGTCVGQELGTTP